MARDLLSLDNESDIRDPPRCGGGRRHGRRHRGLCGWHLRALELQRGWQLGGNLNCVHLEFNGLSGGGGNGRCGDDGGRGNGGGGSGGSTNEFLLHFLLAILEGLVAVLGQEHHDEE